MQQRTQESQIKQLNEMTPTTVLVNSTGLGLQNYSDKEPIQEMPAKSGGDTLQLQNLRNKLLQQPNSADAAISYVKEAMSIYRKTGSARYYGYAKGALSTWWEKQEPPKKIWLARARLLQSDHKFEKAAYDLQAYLEKHPHDIEALLLLADAWKRVGKINHARHICLNIALAGRPTLAQVCALEVRLSGGYYAGAHTTAKLIQEKIHQLPPTEQTWAYAVLAETAVAAKEYQSALDFYESSLATGNADLVTQLHFADVLLELGKNSDVLELLPNQSKVIPVLLRLSIAENQQDTGRVYFREKLEASLNNALVSDNDFLFEKTLYQLYVNKNPVRGLSYAKQNWSRQKAWEDAELLLHSAMSAGQEEYTTAEQKIKVWRSEWGTSYTP